MRDVEIEALASSSPLTRSPLARTPALNAKHKNLLALKIIGLYNTIEFMLYGDHSDKGIQKKKSLGSLAAIFTDTSY